MQAMFPEKSVERMNALMRALHVTLQMLFDAGRSASPDTAYVSDLFSATADGTQSPLIEEMRRQHLHEVLEFTAEISQNLIRAAGGETRVNLSGRLDTFMLITREATSQTLQEIGLPDTRTLSMLETVWKPSEDGHELQVAEILERLRQHTLLKRENTWVLTGTKAVVEKAMAVGPQAGLRSEDDTAVQPRRIRTFKVLDNPFAKTNGYNMPQGLLKEIVRSTRKSDDEDGDEVRRD